MGHRSLVTPESVLSECNEDLIVICKNTLTYDLKSKRSQKTTI